MALLQCVDASGRHTALKKEGGPGSRQGPPTARAVPGLRPNRFRLDLSVRLEPPPPFVPAKAGTQGHLLCSFCRPWVPAFAGTNGLRWRCSLNRLAMEREVEALALGLWFHAQADHHVDDPEKDQRHDRVVDKDDGDADALIDELHRIAFEHTSGA